MKIKMPHWPVQFFSFLMYEAVNLNNGIRLGGVSKWYASLLHSANQRRPFRFCVGSRLISVQSIILKTRLSFEKIGYECKTEKYLEIVIEWTALRKWTVFSSTRRLFEGKNGTDTVHRSCGRQCAIISQIGWSFSTTFFLDRSLLVFWPSIFIQIFDLSLYPWLVRK